MVMPKGDCALMACPMSENGSPGMPANTTASPIATTDSGSPKDYTVEIEEIDWDNEEYKNMLIHVTDEELLRKTGGIVQGMSGSPIIQDGKLAGAVTHVLVNDPERGFGIFCENMYHEGFSGSPKV